MKTSHRWTAVAAVSLVFASSLAPPAVAARAWLIPPVDAAIGRRFEAPAVDWGAGHRGIDYDVASGTLVRSAASGTVVFAGTVAGVRAVTIAHDGHLETTYSVLGEIFVREGESIGQGRWIARSGSSHPGRPGGLHFGVKLADRYVDPEDYLGPIDVTGALHLAPLASSLSADAPDVVRKALEVDHVKRCIPARSLGSAPSPPNDNVVVALAGLASKTEGGVAADMYEHGPEHLGYAPSRIYRFSYRGTRGPRLHDPYERTDTQGDLRQAAARLRGLLVRIARRHPGRDVDLIAHSQGGIVARTFLEGLAESWDARLPRIDHLVTFATPHRGAPLARLGRDLEERTWSGRFVVEGLSRWAQGGGPLPDPRSIAVAQLSPGSSLMEWLASEDVMFGTRVLSVVAPNDWIVPADRAEMPEAVNRVVAPSGGLSGHKAVVRSRVAKGLAHAFLRDAPESCRRAWDDWGRPIGRAIGAAEGTVARLYGAGEEWVAERILRAAWRVARFGAALGRGASSAGRLVRAGVAKLW